MFLTVQWGSGCLADEEGVGIKEMRWPRKPCKCCELDYTAQMWVTRDNRQIGFPLWWNCPAGMAKVGAVGLSARSQGFAVFPWKWTQRNPHDRHMHGTSATGPAALKFSWTFPTVPSFNLCNNPWQEAGKRVETYFFLMIKVGLIGKERSSR